MSQSQSASIPKFKSLETNPISNVKQWYVDNTKNILKVLKSETKTIDLNTTTLVDFFKSLIKEIRVSDDTVHIKLNKNLIIESDNIAQISNGLNIQIAKQIHLNPELKGLNKS